MDGSSSEEENDALLLLLLLRRRSRRMKRQKQRRPWILGVKHFFKKEKISENFIDLYNCLLLFLPRIAQAGDILTILLENHQISASGIFTNTKNISHYHRNNRNHSYRRPLYNSTYNKTSNTVITNATPTSFSRYSPPQQQRISPLPNQMKETMLCGMTSPNYAEDFNIELCSNTQSEKVVVTKRKRGRKAGLSEREWNSDEMKLLIGGGLLNK